MFLQDFSKPFTRIMGCTARELQQWLDRSLPGAQLTKSAGEVDGHCCAKFDNGELRIEWHTIEARRIALLTIPQLQVEFNYSGLPIERRRSIQSYFDLATQRGGG